MTKSAYRPTVKSAGATAVIVLITLWAGSVLVARASEAAPDSHGFPSYYTAAHLLLSGPVDNLENRGWFRDRYRELGFSNPDVSWGKPPPLAFVMVPLAALGSPKLARALWTWVSVLLLLAGVACMRRLAIGDRQGAAHVVGALSLFCFAALYEPFHSNLKLGQLYVLLFFIQSAA